MLQHLEKIHKLENDHLRTQYFRSLRDASVTVAQPTSDDFKALSFEIALAIVNAEAPHASGYQLVLPVLRQFVNRVLHEDPSEYLQRLSLSRTSVGRRINAMAEEVDQIRNTSGWNHDTEQSHCLDLLLSIRSSNRTCHRR